MADVDLYATLNQDKSPLVDIKEKQHVKKAYFDFLQDFKIYLTEFVREASVDLVASSMEVNTTPTRIMDGSFGGFRIVFKNQGEVPCLLSTDRQGYFRLDPNEKQEVWLNQEMIAVTVSGVTSLGFIRS